MFVKLSKLLLPEITYGILRSFKRSENAMWSRSEPQVSETVKSLFIFPEHLEGLSFSATFGEAKNQSHEGTKFFVAIFKL